MILVQSFLIVWALATLIIMTAFWLESAKKWLHFCSEVIDGKIVEGPDNAGWLGAKDVLAKLGKLFTADIFIAFVLSQFAIIRTIIKGIKPLDRCFDVFR